MRRFELTIQTDKRRVRYAELVTPHDAVDSIEIVARDEGLLNDDECIMAIRRIDDKPEKGVMPDGPPSR